MHRGTRWFQLGMRLFSAVIVLSLLVMPVAPVQAQGDADLEANKELIRRVAEDIYNQQDIEAVAEVYAPGLIVHEASDAEMVLETIEEIQAYIFDDFEFFPDLHIDIHTMIAEGDRVVAQYTISAETAGVSVNGVYIARIADGKIVEEWNQSDDLGMMAQLGLVEMPAEMMEPHVVAEGFNGPLGVLVDAEGNIWVADSGLGGDETVMAENPETGEVVEAMLGDTARIVMVSPDGDQTEVAALPSVHVGMDNIGAGRLAVLDGALYATSGEWVASVGPEPLPLTAAVLEIRADDVVVAAEPWVLEEAANPDGAQLHSHPYDIAAGPDGMLYVADAGGNTLLRIDPSDGMVELVAVFDPMPGVFPNPNRDGELLRDAVPTGIEFGDDGTIYVALLSGAPFIPGTAKVVAVDADGTVGDYATGLTMLTDLTAGPDGAMYAVQFGIFTDQGPQLDSGAIVRVHEGTGSEVVLDGLSFPTSIDFDPEGNAYISINGVGPPGSGAILMAPALTEVSGMSMLDEEMVMEEDAPALPETAMGPAIPQDKGYLVEEIIDGIYWVTEGTYQVMFLTTGEGVIVVDAPPSLSPFLLDAIAEVTDEPITHVIYSHFHADHIGGAAVFPEDAIIIAQEETAAALADLDADDADREYPFGLFLGGGPVPLPTETFVDSYTLEVGDKVLELDYLGANHTGGNLFIFAPDHGVLMLVDVIFPGWEPFYGLAIASDIAGFIEAHEQTLAYDFDTLVAGHLTRLGTRTDVETQMDYILDIRDNAVSALQTVDPMAIGMEVGFSNLWTFFSAYLDAVAQECAAMTVDTWEGRLGGVGEFTESHCWIMAEYLRVE